MTNNHHVRTKGSNNCYVIPKLDCSRYPSFPFFTNILLVSPRVRVKDSDHKHHPIETKREKDEHRHRGISSKPKLGLIRRKHSAINQVRTQVWSSGGLNSINIVISNPARTAACVPTVTFGVCQRKEKRTSLEQIGVSLNSDQTDKRKAAPAVTETHDGWKNLETALELYVQIYPSCKSNNNSTNTKAKEVPHTCMTNVLKFELCRLNSFSLSAVACCFKALCNCNLSAANIVYYCMRPSGFDCFGVFRFQW